MKREGKKIDLFFENREEDLPSVDFGLTSSPTSVGLFLGGEVVSYKKTPPPPISMYQNILFSFFNRSSTIVWCPEIKLFAELRSKFFFV